MFTPLSLTGRLNGYVNQEIADIESKSLHAADKIITVSEYTKGVVCEHYHIPDYKIDVVHNGVDIEESAKILYFLTRSYVHLLMGKRW